MLTDQHLIQMARQRFRCFVPIMDDSYRFSTHHVTLGKKLEQVASGDVRRLMVMMPPRHGKSQQTSRLFPPWFLGNHPDREVIFATYAQKLADKFGRYVRNTIASQRFQAIFPECRLAPDSSSVQAFSTTAGGNYVATGVGGALTGLGGDVVIIDDPHKNREEANSATMRQNVVEWFYSTLYTRLSPAASLVLVQTRWHMDDLAGHLLTTQPGQWEVLCLPAISEEGEALWPERWPLEKLDEIKADIGGMEFAALYQQTPTPAGGGIVKREWLRFYTELPTVKRYSWSWDTAIKPGQENDYSVGQLWAECEDGYYLVNLWRAKVEYPELKRQVQLLYDKNRASEVIVEDKASGQQLVQDFRRGGTLPVIGVTPGRDMPKTKGERLNLVSPLFEAGKVFLPKGQSWVSDYVEEIVSFPSAVHDDQVDATTQYLCRAKRKIEAGVIML